MLRRLLHSVFLGAAALTVATCAELFDSGPRVDTISLAGTTRVVLVGGTLQLSAITLDVSGNVLTGRLIRWESDNTDVATVSPAGLVTGVSSGQVNITATSEGSATSEAVYVGTLPAGSATVTASAGPGLNEITVRWPGIPGATSYNVYWGTTPDITPQNGTKVSAPSTGASQSWRHEGLTANTTYYYVVTAVSDFGEGPPSTEVATTASADIGLELSCPGSNGIGTTPLNVAVRVVSNFQVVHATATVEGRSTDLVFDSQTIFCTRTGFNYRAWVGTIPLDGLPRGQLTVTVSATDAFSHTAQASGVFRHDQPPTLTIATPDFSVARPNLRLAASCQDDDPTGCTSVSVKIDGGPMLATGETGVDQTVSLAEYDGQELKLVFAASDSAGQVTTVSRHVFVELSTQLSEVASVDGLILDVQSDRILFLNQSTGGNALTIRDRASGSDVVIYNESGHIPQYGFLTPLGAIFLESTGGSAPTMLHEWKAGGTSDFGAASSLLVQDRYALYLAPGGLIRRDVVGALNTTVSASGIEGDVAANGDVVYRASNQILRYRNGVSTQLTSDGTGTTNHWPATDGVNVIYSKGTGAGTVITLYDAAGERLLASGTAVTSNRVYRVANGWAAYPKGGQVWTRSPMGQEVQATAFSSLGALDALGPNGEIVAVNTVINPGISFYRRRWVAVPNYGTPREIGSGLGSPFFQNGNLFVTIGRSLFQVNP